jgi:ABC-type uncharacterized transport system involved in gliding motility auxiliary subunit
MSKTLGRVLGPLGLLLVFFSGFTLLFLTGEINWLVALQLGLGVGGIAFWGATAFEDARRIATGRGTVFVVTSAVTVVALLGVLVGANYWVSRKHVEFDLTKNKLHTLADETKTMLKALTPETKVKVTAFYKPITDQEYGAAEDLLRRYKNYGGDNFEYEFVDYQKDPQRARALGVTPQSARIFFKSANGKESRAKEPSEESLTNALSELSKGTEKKIFFLTGHGEKGMAKGAETALGLKLWQEGLLNEGFKSEDLNLLARKDVPLEAQVVVIAGPQAPLQAGEVAALKTYAENGGRLVIMEDPGFETGLEPLLASWGVEFLKGIVIDPSGQAPLLAFTQEFADHPISTPRRTMAGALADIFPEARGLKKGTVPAGFTVTELFKTGAEAWGENTPIDPNQPDQRVSRDPTDDAGPIVLAMAVSHKKEGEGDHEMRVVVFGDSDWCSNNFIRQGGNHDLALNTVQWLAGQESKITIRPKMRDKSTIANFNANERLMLSFVSLQLLPLVLIAFGLTIWVVRRSK